MKFIARFAAGAAVAALATIGLPSAASAAVTADCDVATNQWAYCYDSAPLREYQYSVKCYDDGIANRFTYDYGPWRNQSGTYRSYATCPPGDMFHSHYISFR